MDIHFSCPSCKGPATIRLAEEEARLLKDRIKNEGRSPTLIVRCEKGHELLVTLYNTKDGLGVRDVVLPVRSGPKKGSEMDWIKSAFGG